MKIYISPVGSVHVAERSPTIRRILAIMCENHPSSFCSNQERQTGFSARGEKKKDQMSSPAGFSGAGASQAGKSASFIRKLSQYLSNKPENYCVFF